jgi:hypothetical protein
MILRLCTLGALRGKMQLVMKRQKLITFE